MNCARSICWLTIQPRGWRILIFAASR